MTRPVKQVAVVPDSDGAIATLIAVAEDGTMWAKDLRAALDRPNWMPIAPLPTEAP